ncbi:MAG: hypothetical protein AAGE52_11310 [Myxococcota bacterium]
MKHILVVFVLSCGGPKAQLSSPASPAQPPHDDLRRAEVASWGLRVVRPCGVGGLFDGGNWVIACSSVFDGRSGRYLRQEPLQRPLARVAEGTLWAGADDRDVALYVRDPSFVVTRRLVPAAPVTHAVVAGSTIFGLGETFVAIDLDRETVTPVSTCPNHSESTAFVSPAGSLHCATRDTSTTTVYRDGEQLFRHEGTLTRIRIDRGGRYVGQHDDGILWFDREGRLLHQETRPGGVRFLGLLRDSSALVHVDERVERWNLSDGSVRVTPLRETTHAVILDHDEERLLLGLDDSLELWTDRGGEVDQETIARALGQNEATDARFVGPDVVAKVGYSLLWFARGAAAELPNRETVASFGRFLEHCMRLTRNEDGHFGDHVGGLSDAHVYLCDGNYLRVQVSDAEEFADFGDDAAWARAVMQRYGGFGGERWAYSWRDERGDRILVGHVEYEQTHALLTFAERGEHLEHYDHHIVEGEVPFASFLSIPDDALSVVLDAGS